MNEMAGMGRGTTESDESAWVRRCCALVAGASSTSVSLMGCGIDVLF